MKLNFEIEYRTRWGESVAVNLGSNDTVPVFLNTADGVMWHGSAEVELPTGCVPLLYRYSIWVDGRCTRRELAALPHVIRTCTVRNDDTMRDHWNDAERVAGVAVPVFSLRSEGSFGVGDLGDLRAMIDWAASVGMKAVQILPINDTTSNYTWTDSYPYNAISVYAYHPQYVDIRQLPPLADQEKASAYEQKRRELNALDKIDYVAVNDAKRAYLHDIFEQVGAEMLASAGYEVFARNNSDWLMPYAVFSVLRDKFGTSDSRRWPQFSTYDANAIGQYANRPEVRPLVQFYCYVQYVLHCQLLAVSLYARQKEVILKGDIPIGVNRASVETWTEPECFNMKGQTGAPPDAFSVNGQNWGFPTYNWERMLCDGLRWWKNRFRRMSAYFSAYRIDHILGFFRIWEIPADAVHGLLGQFSPAIPMSVEEIESYGLPFQKEFMTRPFINNDLLERTFGPLRRFIGQEKEGESPAYEGKDPVQFVKETFLDWQHDDIWAMKPQFDTQRKVELFYSGKRKERNLAMRDGLYALISNVLFLPDHRNPELYHPRIMAMNDYLFTRLQQWEKDAFCRLHEDFFYHRHNQYWYEQAMRKLPQLVNATQMIVCGEDLGMVPECVPWVMKQLDILTLEIQRMPKSLESRFGHVADYPELSVCTTGSHDTETLRQWWAMDREQTQAYWTDELGMTGDAPLEATPEVCGKIIGQHLECPSLLCILPLQDWLALDGTLRHPDADAERINIPANPRHYWRYRMHLNIEQLASANDFNRKLREMIEESGR